MKFFKISTLVLLLLFASGLQAQMQRQNYQILGISVSGNKSADAATIIANSGLKVGAELEIPGDQTIAAIRQLWALNIFSDIQLEIEKQIDRGVYLVIKVKEFPRIEKAVFEGNDEVSEKDIEEKIHFIRGQILKTQDIYNVRNKIKALYDEEALLNAAITPMQYTFMEADTVDEELEVTWRNTADFSDEYKTTYDLKETGRNSVAKLKERVLLKYKIDEGDVVKVERVSFTGNKSFPEDDLKGTFDETKEKKWWKFWSSAKFNKAKYEEDKNLLVNFYKKNGYRDFMILSDTLLFSGDKSNVNVHLNVYEGPQYKIRNIVWEGNTVYSADILNERLGFGKGDVFNYEKFYQNLRGPNEKQTDVAALYQDNGYLTSNLRATENRVGEDSLDISIKVIENNQFKIGKVDVQGNDKTKDKVIRRELFTVPNDYYNRGAIFTSLQQLANLQYFNVEKLYKEGIDIVPADDSTVNVGYKVEEKSSDYLNASVGYSGSFGFSGAIGVTLTNFSLAEPFSMGGGQILNFNWQFGVGNFYRTFTLGFTEPWFMDTPTLVGFELFDTRQIYIYDLRQSGGTFRVGRRLQWPDHYFNVQSFFRYQANNVKDGGGYYAEGNTKQFTLGLTVSRRNIDNPIFPSLGSSVSLDMEMSGGPVLPGDVDYYKIGLKTEWYKRLFNSNRVALCAITDFGYLDEFKAGTKIQPFEYYYMGGNGLIIATTPLRGYEDRTVGPTNSYGNIVGGRVMSRFTLELRAAAALEPIPIYFLVFAEAGNTWEKLKTTDLLDLKRSVGVGARLLINPIGLVGFDFGYGFDRKSVDGKDPSWIFHFQFGKGF